MKRIKLFEEFDYDVTLKESNLYIYDKDSNEVLGHSLDYNEIQKIIGEKQKGLNPQNFPRLVYGIQTDDKNNPIIFDTLKDAQDWYNKSIEKEKHNELKKVPKTNLGKTLYEISEYVKEKYPNINKGTCYFFTYLISKYFSVDKFVIIEEELEEEPIHMMCKIGNKYYDGTGFHTKKDVLDEYSDSTKDDIHIIDKDEVKYWSDKMDYDYVNQALTTNPLTNEERQDLEDYIKSKSI